MYRDVASKPKNINVETIPINNDAKSKYKMELILASRFSERLLIKNLKHRAAYIKLKINKVYCIIILFENFYQLTKISSYNYLVQYFKFFWTLKKGTLWFPFKIISIIMLKS